ncbi:MAG: class I SAM-dependent methyltransferase, partial [Boseongicola sp.]|nr:class I SAM-dependent methyltransferase [Boseongicola sp.]
MSYDPGVASLWIGGALGWIENVCLRSFLEVGQKVTLFCYEKVANVPEGVIVRDAREIWTPHRRLLRQTGASYLADIFRIHLMSNTDLIWVDCDALCRE